MPLVIITWTTDGPVHWRIYAYPGGWFNIKKSSYQYRKSHCGDKTVVRSSYLHNGISYTGKMTSLYWIRAWVGLIMVFTLLLIASPVYIYEIHTWPLPWLQMAFTPNCALPSGTAGTALIAKLHQFFLKNSCQWPFTWKHNFFQHSGQYSGNIECYYRDVSLDGFVSHY